MTLSDLPEIQITRNVRSTRLRLRVDATQIRLTAPVFCSKKQIQHFIEQSESWLIKTWQSQQEKIENIDRTLPSELRLFNLKAAVKISYHSQKNNFIFDHEDLQLWISDRHPEEYLKTFVIAYAKEQLPSYLNLVSQQCRLPFKNCSIRQPKTRWGSCSAKHDIMLNSALVLFPEQVTRYVAVHELAHTKHFDHSPHFWVEVAKHDQHFQQHRKALKNMPLPYWWGA